MKKTSKCWETIDEMRAIDFIARENDEYKNANRNKPVSKKDRIAKLKGYLASCEVRVNWGHIIKDDAVAYAQQKLAGI